MSVLAPPSVVRGRRVLFHLAEARDDGVAALKIQVGIYVLLLRGGSLQGRRFESCEASTRLACQARLFNERAGILEAFAVDHTRHQLGIESQSSVWLCLGPDCRPRRLLRCQANLLAFRFGSSRRIEPKRHAMCIRRTRSCRKFSALRPAVPLRLITSWDPSVLAK